MRVNFATEARAESKWPAVLAIGIAVTIFSSISPADTPPEEHPDLSGTWELNEELSDDFRQKMMEARRSGRLGGPRSGGGGMGGGRGGFGGGMGGGRGGMGGGQRGGRSGNWDGERPPGEGPPGILRGIELLQIEQTASTVTIRYSDDSERILLPDGKKQESELPNGDSLVTSAVWKNDQLIVTAKRKEGGKTTEWYQSYADGERLIVKLDLPGRGRLPAIQLKRVYDLAGST